MVENLQSDRYTFDELNRIPFSGRHGVYVSFVEVALLSLVEENKIMRYVKVDGKEDRDFFIINIHNKLYPFKVVLSSGYAQDYHQQNPGIRTISIMEDDFMQTKNIQTLKDEVFSRL